MTLRPNPDANCDGGKQAVGRDRDLEALPEALQAEAPVAARGGN